jgi:ribonucleoside-diphosphate reductase alpha chain
MLAFESRDAAKLNVEIFRTLQQQSHAASKELASLLGEPPLLVGHGMRNTTTMAIAPTKSSSTILGSVSEGIQPELANAYVADLAKVVTLIKNPYLKSYLQTIDMDTEEVWKSIEANAGSVQHLTFLSDEVKDVFKTFPEISPKAVIEQAAARQTYIDQGQSLNLIFPPSMSPSDINYLFYYAWRLGIKGLYYQIGMSATQAHNVQQLNLKECVACSA